MNLASFLSAAVKIGQAGLQHAPEVISLLQTAKTALAPADQATAQQAIADLQAENDEGFARLDAKLAEAEKR